MIDRKVQRVIAVSNYMIDKGATIRSAAPVFGISKSTVYRDITEKLIIIDKELFLQVRKVLQKNKAQRHIRAGLAVKEKFKKQIIL